MIFSDIKIKQFCVEHDLVSPWHKDHIGPNSYDLTLSREFLFPVRRDIITMDEEFPYESFNLNRVVIPSGAFILASTVEVIKIPNGHVGFIEGRSSWGRRGLFIENAGFVDSGFEGKITLELFNASPSGLEITAGGRICQLVIADSDPSGVLYGNREGSKYMNQMKVTGSKLEEDDY